MSGILGLVILFAVFGLVLGGIAFFAYRRVLRRAKGIERGLKMVPLLIHLPPPADESEQQTMRDSRDVMREKASQAQTLYDLIAGTLQKGFKSNFYGQRHIAFEIIASNGLVHFFAAIPIAMVSTVEQAVLSAYPGARVEEVEDHNIFNPQGRLSGTVGGELVLKEEYSYPISTLAHMERDPVEALINSLIRLEPGDGAAVQIMLRPANPKWPNRGKFLVARKRRQREGALDINPLDLAKAAYKSPDQWHQESVQYQPSKLEESILQNMEEKMRHPGFEVLVRVIASSGTYDRAQMILRNIANSFALFEAPGSNGFRFLESRDIQGLVTAFIFRFFPPEVKSNILATNELATLFHLPNDQFNASTAVERQLSKQVDGPVNLPSAGLLLGYNLYRGIKKEIRLSHEDRRRHMYIIGQTGTGKSTILENIVVQDMLAGNGLAFIDPHGDAAEKLLSMVPKERAEDVIYFNPADMDQPLGINLFEFDSPEQKDFIIQEAINMLYKLYDPDHTGIIGPRFEHWFRNAALTLMADPEGSSFIEIPKVFTDTTYLKNKFKHLQDPTVIDFWTKEMGQTSDYHKSEMLGWFVSKFGAFQSNDMMRNIIGQTKSAFNIREIMDQKKILIVNLSKGMTGDLNSKLLGMIFVIKIQAAAMSRSNVPENERSDFSLIVDEFQNFSTDSFASILSEARKYRLNLIVANQFIGQLSEEIREAVFGNIGTIMSYRCGPEDAEFLIKQFQPLFTERDLINIPNFNAVMKLLIGGLPSLPFSLAAMPPLGMRNPEMGLAVKQLSAAKFGIQRGQVEADIFARLQNQPRPAMAPVVQAPPPPAAEVPVPAAVATTPPTPQPAQAATPVAQVAAVPVTVGAAPAPPVPSPPGELPLSGLKAAVPSPQSVTAQAPPSVQSSVSSAVQPPATPSVPIATVAPPTPPPAVAPAKPVQPASASSIKDIVGATPAPVPPALPASSPKPSVPLPKPLTETPPPVSSTPVQSKPVALIEAHEADGWTDESNKPAEPQSPTQSASTPSIKTSSKEPQINKELPVVFKPIRGDETLNEELKNDIEQSMEQVESKQGASGATITTDISAVQAPPQQDPALNQIADQINEELEEKLESAAHPLISSRKPEPAPQQVAATPVVQAPKLSPPPVSISSPVPPQPQPLSAKPPQAGKSMIATHRTARLADTEPPSQVDATQTEETSMPELPVEPTPQPTYETLSRPSSANASEAVPVVKSAPAAAPMTVPQTKLIKPEPKVEPKPAPVETPVPVSASVALPEININQSSSPEPLVELEPQNQPTTAEPALPAPTESSLKPGEVTVDADGNVVQG